MSKKHAQKQVQKNFQNVTTAHPNVVPGGKPGVPPETGFEGNVKPGNPPEVSFEIENPAEKDELLTQDDDKLVEKKRQLEELDRLLQEKEAQLSQLERQQDLSASINFPHVNINEPNSVLEGQLILAGEQPSHVVLKHDHMFQIGMPSRPDLLTTFKFHKGQIVKDPEVIKILIENEAPIELNFPQ